MFSEKAQTYNLVIALCGVEVIFLTLKKSMMKNEKIMILLCYVAVFLMGVGIVGHQITVESTSFDVEAVVKSKNEKIFDNHLMVEVTSPDSLAGNLLKIRYVHLSDFEIGDRLQTKAYFDEEEEFRYLRDSKLSKQ